MTNFDPTSLDWSAGLLAGWTYEKPVNKWFQGQHRSAHRLTRPCPTCREIIVLDVTRKALQGEATNHGLSLRRCKACRKALKVSGASGEYAERKAAGTAKRAAEPEEVLELERLRKENAEIKSAKPAQSDDSEEVGRLRGESEMYMRSVLVLKGQLDDERRKTTALFAEIQQLKAKLAPYELQPAMEAAKPAFDPHALLAAETAKNKPADMPKKMPWEG